MSELIPRKMSDDQYDKISRQLWEIKLKMQGYDLAVLQQTALDKVCEDHRKLMNRMIRLENMLLLFGALAAKIPLDTSSDEQNPAKESSKAFPE